ncbi:MAG: tRNA dihydrouridine synthase DusB [Bacteroidaceae bacterium]|nr:tRNA dihydrouridine synthase DusB [Bacteroidaceae bacterium]MCF0194799.1 tRNA dihydrouridine synthase DusB [Bacteroidaceae bacterium]
MRIGNIDLGPQPVLLAPMEDVTDIGFRLMCRRLGADMAYSEFVAADALVRMVANSLRKLRIDPEERPAVIQIYGRDPQTVADAARIVVEQARPDIIDLNFGCPVKRVAGKGAGAGMLQNPDLLCAITRAVADAVPVPVTVKTRLGWDDSHKIIAELAERIQDSGAQALTIHGRTRAQMYTGTADWSLIGAVKANPRMRIPIIGNGDITGLDSCREAFERWGVDAVMIGRATFGRPWIFHEIKRPDAPLTSAQKLQLLKEQVLTSVARIDEYRGILHIRRHLAATPLFKGIPNFRDTRIAMLRAETVGELFRIMDSVPLT